jgi:hypothetical protein
VFVSASPRAFQHWWRPQYAIAVNHPSLFIKIVIAKPQLLCLRLSGSGWDWEFGDQVFPARWIASRHSSPLATATFGSLAETRD